MNIKFSYLYRDYSNYKKFNSIVLSNSDNISISEVEKSIRENLIDGEFFNAQNVGLPSLFFDEKNEDDHMRHEFESIQETTDTPNIEVNIENLVLDSERATPTAAQSLI